MSKGELEKVSNKKLQEINEAIKTLECFGKAVDQALEPLTEIYGMLESKGPIPEALPQWEYVADWSVEREEFRKYMQARKYNSRYISDIVSYLDKHVGHREIRDPKDIIEVFAPLTTGQAHHLNRALRVFFNYLEVAKHYPEDWLDDLRRALPKDALRGAVDLNIPSEVDVVESLKRLSKAPLKHRALYNLLLDSGFRLVEAVETINAFKDDELQELQGFFRYPAGMFRRTKQAYYCYLSGYTLSLIMQIGENDKPLDAWTASKFFQRVKCVNPKYIRKFVYDQMTSEAIGIPDSVADFIEGRVPKTIGALHYAKLARKADEYYSRWAKYVEGLRQKAGII
jgi:intergrase/recombinase